MQPDSPHRDPERDLPPDHDPNPDRSLNLAPEATTPDPLWTEDSRFPNGVVPLANSPLLGEPRQPPRSAADDDLFPPPPGREVSLGRLLSEVFMRRFPSLSIMAAIALMVVGLRLNLFWLTVGGATVAILFSLRLLWPSYQAFLVELSAQQRSLLIAIPGLFLALLGLLQVFGVNAQIVTLGRQLRWDVVGAIGDFVGAFGQILIAILAVYVAWRQYVISRDLTVQQNLITQQQTIDAYFQGVSDLVLDDEGLLEDWPQERAIAEGRTAAILSSINAEGKAKVIRFLSQSRLLAPLQRDRHLGRPILDGSGGYAEDRVYGIRVIDLGVMLAAADLSGTDLRWTELSEVNLVRANLKGCDLVGANLSRTILYEANVADCDLMGTRLFYGDVTTASPRSRTEAPNYETGAYTGAVVEGANFAQVKRLDPDQRYYCCAWGGSKTRGTIPGGCEGIPNQLGR